MNERMRGEKMRKKISGDERNENRIESKREKEKKRMIEGRKCQKRTAGEITMFLCRSSGFL